jgi:hypothetical protein
MVFTLPQELIDKISEYATTPFPGRHIVHQHINYEMFRLFIIGSLYREHHVHHIIKQREKWDPNHTGIEIEWAQKIVDEAKALNWDAVLVHPIGKNGQTYTLRIYHG